MLEPEGPVVVGGVGGSGTRLVAEMLRSIGFDLGRDLNVSNDNLWFTLLFRRPRWYEQALADGSGQGRHVMQAIAWFEDAMLGRLRPCAELERLLDDAVEELTAQGLDRPFVWERRQRFLEWGSTAIESRAWGWKEPNSHVYMEQLSQHFGERIRYVHVIRDGIEVARRGNQRQLQNWGPRFGVQVGPMSESRSPISPAVDYWIAANRRALKLGPALFGERFLVVNLNRLRSDPTPGVVRLLEFLEIDATSQLVSELADLTYPADLHPVPADYNGLSEEQRRGFADLGFVVPSSS
jgi:hypothetical protein